ncbi:SCO family protein [Agrobacterium vaccinii]|uniref:SCO family protein n=1 Tax=Agrobacterium vaccinii TaxID=2735528 RepID=UPI001E37E9B9|nr:SCO family protein [Agrobacterium vaccinii]UHS63905.1 SCO family protein [Agrobacterium vaccinii]
MTTRNSKFLKRIRWISWSLIAVLATALAIVWVEGRFATEAEAKPYATPFQLTDQNGATVAERDTLGKPSAWLYGFTHCPDVCPTALAEMAQVLEQLGPEADKLRVVFVSVDPARDTPALLKDYVAYFDERILALTGPDQQLQQMTKARYIYYKKVGEGDSYEMDHTAGVQLVRADGRFFGTLDSHETAEVRMQKIRRLIGE